MQFSMLSAAVLTAILSSAIALPIAGTSSVEETATPNAGFQFKDVQVKCPDVDHQVNFMQCYNDNASKNCDPMKDQPDRHACSQLWEVTCAKRAGCQVS